MTGYGTATTETEGWVGTVEIRTVNSRFREIKVRSPLSAGSERRLKQAVERAIGRGRAEVTVHLERDVAQDLAVDPARLDAVAGALAQVTQALGAAGVTAGPVDPVDALRLATQKSGRDTGDEGPQLELASRVLARALEGLVAMREQEGESLRGALADLLADVEGHLQTLGTLAQQQAPMRLANYRARLAELVEGGPELPEPERIAQEVAILATKADVTEELARIESHIRQMRGVLEEQAAVGQGKRLDFLCQEFVREFSTLGAKIDSAEGKREVIAAKATLERIREQVQNVE